jgi:hypothetical protein
MASLPRALAVALAGFLASAPASAVLIASGDGTGNTTAPPSDPGWSHVGGVNGLSGVYLGDAWVLTANHVGTGPVSLGGVTYPTVAASSIRLEHTPGVLTDLRLYRLVSDPGLATLPISASSPPAPTEVLMIGRGRDRGIPYTFGSYTGWRWAATSSQRWGTNAVSQGAFNLTVLGAPLRALGLSFNNLGGGPPEAIGTAGDSGGPAFVGSNLAGILVAVWSYGGQAAGTAVFGNGTYVADLSYYRNQILGITTERACSDGLDDDGDGLADWPEDPGCYGPDDPFETNAIVPCDDGFDSDGDGLVDWPDDPGCQLLISLMEDPACDDGVDNDDDTFIDWDGGAGGVLDPQCADKPWRNNEAPSSGCGLGFELALLAPLFAWRWRRNGERTRA